MKNNMLLSSIRCAALALPELAAEGFPGATVKSDGASGRAAERQAMRERCRADPEKCREEMKARAGAQKDESS